MLQPGALCAGPTLRVDILGSLHQTDKPDSLQVGALLAAYTLAMFACYSLVPLVLNWSGAAVLNLSLLSSNLWAALARALLLGQLSDDSHSYHDTPFACTRSKGDRRCLAGSRSQSDTV